MRARSYLFALLGASLFSDGVAQLNSFFHGKSARIIGGGPADRSTYPKSMVMIANRMHKLVCGGTLISPTLVLTAAHCTKGITSFVHVGRYDRDDPDEEYDIIPIVARRPHPLFDMESLDHDIMLLQLERPTTKTDIEYMRVNSVDVMPPVGIDLMAMGWGETQPSGSFNEGTPVLQVTDKLVYVSNEDCNDRVNEDEDYRGKIMDTMLCTFSPVADHCFGDSGGPILAFSARDPSSVMQVAVISWGADTCADGFFPGVNQRTSTSFDWIASVVCAVDGSDDEGITSRYGCQEGQTHSPMPSQAPFAPTPPTPYTETLWVELFMDEFPEDITWFVMTRGNGTVVEASASYEGNTDDVILERVSLLPGESYTFVITDDFGDGFKDGGFYRISLGPELASSIELFTGNLEDRAEHDFETTESISLVPPTMQPSLTPSRASTILPSSKPAPSPIVVTSPPVAPQTCAAFGEECLLQSDCCSGRCTLNTCQKSSHASPARTDNQKMNVMTLMGSDTIRGGAAGKSN